MLLQVVILIVGVYTNNVCGIDRNHYFFGPSVKKSDESETTKTVTLSKDGRHYAKDFSYGQYISHQPTLISHLLNDIHTLYTPTEAAVKSPRSADVSSHDSYENGPNTQYSYDNHGDFRYHGPIAITHIFPDGHIADTPGVNVAKAAYLEAVSKAKKSQGGSYDYEGNYKQEVVYENFYNSDTPYHCICYGSQGNFTFHLPTAFPRVMEDGLSDPTEVAAAKASHYASLSKGKANEYEYSGILYTGGDSAEEGNKSFSKSVDWKFGSR